MTIETVVISALLIRPFQYRLSGRSSAAFRLSRVGGHGTDAGEPVMWPPGLNTFTTTRYSGTANTAVTTSATSGRTHGACESSERAVTAPPPAVAAAAAPRSTPPRR